MSLKQRLQQAMSDKITEQDALAKAKAKKITDHIEETLQTLAKQGAHKGTVHQSNYTERDFPGLSRGSSGNWYCAWRDKVITEADLRRAMSGVFKEIFEFCADEGLEPTIEYWTDNGGMAEGFEIVVHW